MAVSTAEETADTVKYSSNLGNTWTSYKFTDEPLIITGVLTEPGNKAMSVAVWGYRPADKIWVVHTFNFTVLMDRQCRLCLKRLAATIKDNS